MRWLLTLFLTLPLFASPAFPGKISFIRDGDLWLWEGGQEQRIVNSGQSSGPRFSYDGRYVSYHEGPRSYVIDLDSEARWELPDVLGSPQWPVWSPHENRLAYPTMDGVAITLISSDGPGPSQIITPKGWTNPSWAPDGKRLAMTKSTPGAQRGAGYTTIGTVALVGGEPSTVVRIDHSVDAYGCGISGISIPPKCRPMGDGSPSISAPLAHRSVRIATRLPSSLRAGEHRHFSAPVP